MGRCGSVDWLRVCKRVLNLFGLNLCATIYLFAAGQRVPHHPGQNERSSQGTGVARGGATALRVAHALHSNYAPRVEYCIEEVNSVTALDL